MNWTPLGNVARIQVGYQTRKSIKENKNGTHRLIQRKDFGDFHILNTETLTVFSPERNPDLYTVREGDILFQARGRDHFAFYLNKELQNTLAAGSFYIVRPEVEKVIPQYVVWWLNQKSAQLYIRTKAVGTVMSFISKTALSQLKIPLSSISIQQKIKNITTLWQREQLLQAQLAERRARLVNSICLKAIYTEGVQ